MGIMEIKAKIDKYFEEHPNVKKGLKIADIDPRLSEYENCFTISDKARSIGGAVVVAIMHNDEVYGKWDFRKSKRDVKK